MCNSGIKLEKSSRFPYLSIIPYSSEAVVSIRGVLYEIKNKKIKKGQTIGISNEITERSCRISVNKGTVIIVRSSDSRLRSGDKEVEK